MGVAGWRLPTPWRPRRCCRARRPRWEEQQSQPGPGSWGPRSICLIRQRRRGGDDGRALAHVVGAVARAAWGAVQGCRNVSRRPAVVGALLEAVLQPRLFWRAGDDGRYRRAPPCALMKIEAAGRLTSGCQQAVQCCAESS